MSGVLAAGSAGRDRRVAAVGTAHDV